MKSAILNLKKSFDILPPDPPYYLSENLANFRKLIFRGKAIQYGGFFMRDANNP
jgi:hypothetical protein